MSSKDSDNHLIAVLHRTNDGEIKIESRLDERESSQAYSIPVLIRRPEETEEAYTASFKRCLNEFMRPDDPALKESLTQKSGNAEYDEWEWLKRLRPDSKSIISFSDMFPENYTRHDLKLPCIDEKDFEVFFINQEYDEEECEDPDLEYSDDFYEDDPHEYDYLYYDDNCDADAEVNDRMKFIEFEVHDESLGPPFGVDKNSPLPQSPMSLKDFTASQNSLTVTNKNAHQKNL